MGALVPKLRHQLWLGLKFGMVGAGSVLVYFGVLVVLMQVIANTVALTAISYAASAVFNYMLQSTFTFRAHAIDVGIFSRYFVTHGTCMILNSLLMFGLVDVFGSGIVRAQVIVTVVVAGASFVLSSFWVYMPPGAANDTEPGSRRRRLHGPGMRAKRR